MRVHSMIHRATLVVGAFVATAIMSFAAGMQHTPPTPVADATPDVVAAAPAVAEVVPTPQPTAAAPEQQTVTDTVYVLPTPEPAVVHVTRQAPPTIVKTKRPPASPTATRAPRQRAGSDDGERDDERDGEHESESEGGDD
jgi:hypothetical protein